LFTLATAPRRLFAALAVALLVVPTTATGGRAADIAPGGGGVIAADSPVLVRTEPGFDAPAAGEAAPGAWVTVVSGPHYDADGNAWYETDAGGFVPTWAVGEGAVAAQEAAAEPVSEEAVAYEEAAPAEPVYEDPAAVSEEPVYEEVPAEVASEEPVAAEAAPVYEEPAVEPAPVYDEPAAPAYDPNAVVATAWIGGTNGDGAVCRAGMGFETAEVGWLAEGEPVSVIGDTAGEWQPVNCQGQAAFVHASFIAWEQPTTMSSDAAGDDWVNADPAAEAAALDAAEEQRGRRGKDDRGNGNGNGNNGGGEEPAPSGGGSGQAIVDFAMQYVGYPYAYAGEGPHAFDCSGFTMYVVRETLGTNITHDMFTQVGMGQSVSRGELQPGDLVFFENTFRRGLSHAGIYIGGGQFVHAENESTGVVVSDLNSDYYGSRFYGATRLT
jgi:cell wall-associated NlpC family hydrolase